jgi:hypothetical protein
MESLLGRQGKEIPERGIHRARDRQRGTLVLHKRERSPEVKQVLVRGETPGLRHQD